MCTGEQKIANIWKKTAPHNVFNLFSCSNKGNYFNTVTNRLVVAGFEVFHCTTDSCKKCQKPEADSSAAVRFARKGCTRRQQRPACA